ncbi:16784_t:CDS:2 [Funneliformis geosporum]|uniref:16784_t:CDS:1 n=1 Tax=Funneliformis geosporum TaxID=1117311 RepID=A0A9W4SCC1_9GLOM|nr:16784_t:CDS:2 [Funneliformis geosporum]
MIPTYNKDQQTCRVKTPRYNGHPCCGKPEQSVMLCGDIHALEGEDLGILLRETLKLSFVHVQKKSHVGYAHVHTSMRVIFFHDYKDIILDGPSKTELATLKKPSKISILVCSSTASDAEIIRLIIVSLVTSSGCGVIASNLSIINTRS